MAPRKMPVRRQQTREISKVLSEGTYTTTDPQGQINVMRQYQAANLIPKQFEVPNQVSDAVSAEMASGLTKEQALKKLNITLPRSFFDNKGKLIGRKFRDAQSPALIEAWNKATGGMPAETLGKLEGSEWSNQQKVLQEVGRRLGMKLDLGHFETSASGAPGNIAAAGGEYALANQAAGRSLENPPRPQTQAEVPNVGMATNKVEGLSEAALFASGLPTRGGLTGSPLNPYIAVLLGTTLNGKSSRLLSKNNLEILNYTFDQLVKQKLNPVAMYDYIRERAGENIDINEMARAGQEQYDISKFAPKVESPNAGPVTVVQAATPKGPTVTTKGVPKGLTSEPQVVLTTEVQSGPSRLIQKGTTVTKYKTPKLRKALGKAGPVAGGAAVALALLSDNPAEAIPIAAETFTPLGDLQGAPEPSVTMVNVNGRLRPLNTDTNTLMDKPGFGLEQKGGKWREVRRGTGAATKQQQAQTRKIASQVMPTINRVNAAVNPVSAFLTNVGKEAYKRVFGNREI